MKSITRRFGLVLAVLCAVGLMAQNAYAGPGATVFVIEGSGGISPGAGPIPVPQSVSFNGVLAGVTVVGNVTLAGVAFATGTAAGLGSCSFAGNGTESLVQGQGTASGSCSGATVGAVSITCQVTYVRVGVLVVITAICTIVASGPAGSGSVGFATGTGVFTFVPTSAPGAPVTAFALVGAAGGAGIS